jgi:hypothetical protein
VILLNTLQAAQARALRVLKPAQLIGGRRPETPSMLL